MGAENRFNIGSSQKCKALFPFFCSIQSFLLQVLQLCKSTNFRGILIYRKCKRGSKVICSDMWESQGVQGGLLLRTWCYSIRNITAICCVASLFPLPFKCHTAVLGVAVGHTALLRHPGEQGVIPGRPVKGNQERLGPLARLQSALCFNDSCCQTLHCYASELIYWHKN